MFNIEGKTIILENNYDIHTIEIAMDKSDPTIYAYAQQFRNMRTAPGSWPLRSL